MNWEDEAFLLSKRKFRENANIINVFTSTRGKVSGIVYGGNSRKIRNYLQIGNKIHVIFNSKNENRIGYLKTELIEPISPKYFNDKKKILCLLSLTSLLNLLLPEGQKYNHIYSSINKLIRYHVLIPSFSSASHAIFHYYAISLTLFSMSELLLLYHLTHYLFSSNISFFLYLAFFTPFKMILHVHSNFLFTF